MDPMKLPKAVAEQMAEDVRIARHRILRKATVEELYVLMVLRETLLDIAQRNWLTSLSNRLERGQHHLDHRLEVGLDEAQEVANEMAADLRHMRDRTMELSSPDLTEQDLRDAETVFRKYGQKVNLVDRFDAPKEIHPN